MSMIFQLIALFNIFCMLSNAWGAIIICMVTYKIDQFSESKMAASMH